MVAPLAPSRVLSATDIARGVIANRPPWLGTCRWCLAVIFEPVEDSGWQHVYQGVILCRHPLPGAPYDASAVPLDPENPVADFEDRGCDPAPKRSGFTSRENRYS
jgi:hypothetical protein